MVDTVSVEKRSEIMRRIRSKGTLPEMKVRKLIHSLGYRYRLHGKYLPGKPDLVFSARKKVIFVHGCFWHRHLGCAIHHWPKSNESYWRKKIETNAERDKKNLNALNESGWECLTVWECEINDSALVERIKNFLGPQRR